MVVNLLYIYPRPSLQDLPVPIPREGHGEDPAEAQAEGRGDGQEGGEENGGAREGRQREEGMARREERRMEELEKVGRGRRGWSGGRRGEWRN